MPYFTEKRRTRLRSVPDFYHPSETACFKALPKHIFPNALTRRTWMNMKDPATYHLPIYVGLLVERAGGTFMQTSNYSINLSPKFALSGRGDCEGYGSKRQILVVYRSVF
jgi:hypothetical protein